MRLDTHGIDCYLHVEDIVFHCYADFNSPPRDFMNDITNLVTMPSRWAQDGVRHEANKAWAAAGRAWRKHLAKQSDDSVAYYRYGECLLRLGYLGDAKGAFTAASQNEATRSAAFLRLGQLALAENRTQQARELLDLAAADALSSIDIRSEIFVQLQNMKAVTALNDSAERREFTVLFSGPNLGAKATGKRPQTKLGSANYSYAFAAKGFLEAIETAGVDPIGLLHPECIANGPDFFDADACVHLRFSPPDDPRLVKGATNILLFAWEFDELPNGQNWLHPFSDRKAMIERFDEVWMPSRHGQRVISSITNAEVRYVPSPVLPGLNPRFWTNGRFNRLSASKASLPAVEFVPLAVFPQRQPQAIAWATREALTLPDLIKKAPPKTKFFLTVVNPHDQRKNLRPLLEAFASFARENPDAILLVKSSAHDFTTYGINDLIFTHQLARQEEVLEAFISRNIWICNEKLSDDDLDRLYGLADYYICSPIAEGQNLPLLEAMLRGCIPITPCHTAMLDYITSENAVIIPSRRTEPSRHIRSVYNLETSEIDIVGTNDVLVALNAAWALIDEAEAALRAQAIRTVEQQFGANIVKNELTRLKEKCSRPKQNYQESIIA